MYVCMYVGTYVCTYVCMCVVLKMHLMYVLDEKIARVQANCNMFAWAPVDLEEVTLLHLLVAPVDLEEVICVCMFVPCIVCLPAEGCVHMYGCM